MPPVRLTLLTLLLMQIGPTYLIGQRHKGSPNDLAVDVVFMKDGTVMYGVISGMDETVLTLVVPRDWLQQHRKDFYKDHLARETTEAVKANKELVERIRDWLKERPDDATLKIFLEDQLKLAETAVGDGDRNETRFTYVRIKRQDIRRTVVQDSPARHAALVAWKHNLKNVCTRTRKELVAELKSSGIEIADEKVDFTSDVPAQPQSGQQWAIRKAIVEYELRDRNLQFQGTGDSFFRREQNQGTAVLMAQLMQGAMGGGSLQQIGQELGLPEFTNGKNKSQQRRNAEQALKKLSRTADQEGYKSFSVTRLKQNLLDPQVTVQWILFVKVNDGDWIRYVSQQGRANADQQDQASVDALKQEPQIKQILELFGGIGGGGESLDKAIRHGVATQSAMQTALDKSRLFIDPFTKSLTNPDVVVPK